MIKDMEYHQDDKTVLLDRTGQAPASSTMTDFAAPPRFEQLEERMIYAARLRPAQAFNISLNSLVAAASELLSEVVRLKHSETHEDLYALNERLTTGLKLFDVRALQNGAESSQVMAARYVLCSVLDEAVVTTTWGNESEWSQMSLLSSFHNETFGGEKFFHLLERISKDPVKHLPMLELMYLCMSLGFEGKYRVQARGMLELEAIRDALYRQIRQLRGDVPRELSPQWQGLNDQRRSLVRIVPAWMVLLFTFVCLLVMYSGFGWVLGQQRDTILQPYQPLGPAGYNRSRSRRQVRKMKNFFKKVGALLRKTWVWTLLLVLFVALLVWFVGPLLAVDDHRFWESATSRLLTISMLFLFWGLTMVFVGWRAGVRRRAVEESQGGQDRLRREEHMDEEQKALKARFKDALKTLKTSSLYRGRSERWRNDLPWYLLIGPQGSGKTSLLDFSGLEFPINRIDRKLTRDTQGTRYCDWYFADHGVLIDTAGRYLDQPDAQVDGSAWSTLLDLLRKRRRNRPLNGVLVTIPVDTLLSSSEQGLQDLARQVRTRLQQVHQKLHVDVPVYLVLSKADGLIGFDEFFDQLTREESDQVLGISFRKEQCGTDVVVLRAEFEALLHRLNSQVIMRMHQERATQRRGRILDFPHQLGQVGERLCLFVDMAFTGNRYQRAAQLRGFYLTNAPHLVEQMDGSTASIGANLDIDAGVLPTLHSGRSRFIHNLLSHVIFPEADLAGLDKRERSRIHWGQRVLYVGALAALAVFGMLWAGGFSANYERLENLRNLAQTWTQQRSTLTPHDDSTVLLKSLDTRYAATQVFPKKDDVGYHERVGLYQGKDVNPVVTAAYERDLEEQLLPRMATLIEDQIRASLSDRERLLNSLRAYLMLNMADRRDAPWLKDWVAAEWSRRYTGNTALQNGLNAHFARLLNQPFSYPLNDQLVTQARQVLRSESLANVVYRMLRDQARNLPEYRLSQHLGPQGLLFVGTDYVIPGFYTQQGYQQYFSVQGSMLVSDILSDNWVLGEGTGISDMDLRRLLVELEQLYFRDYANYWGEAVGQVELPPINDFGEGAEQLAGLTSADSPVLQLLLEVRENTRFQTAANSAEEAADAAGKLAEKGGKLGNVATLAADKVSGALAKNLPDTAKKSLQRRFEPLHRLLDDDNGPSADLTPALNALNDLQLQMASLARASAPEQAAFEMAKTRMGGQRDALSNLRSASGRLPRPVSAWFGVLAEDTWRLVLGDAYAYLNQRYQAELYGFYGKAINKRYPFDAHSPSDVAISDFREFFKNQGIAERFFDSYLRPFVSGDPGSYRLRNVDGYSLPISKVYLEQMAVAQVIRQSFFASDAAEPQVQFKLEPYTLDPSVSRSEFKFGDTTLEYRHGPIVAVSFRWPTDAEDGRTSLVLDKIVGRPIGIEKNTGPWSLFRLFDLMQTEYLTGRDVMVLKADVGSLRANYLLTSQRAPNPFDMGVLRSFRMPVQL